MRLEIQRFVYRNVHFELGIASAHYVKAGFVYQKKENLNDLRTIACKFSINVFNEL